MPKPTIAEFRALAAQLDAEQPKGGRDAMVRSIVDLAEAEPDAQPVDAWSQRMLGREIDRLRRMRERHGDERVQADIAANAARLERQTTVRAARAAAPTRPA